MALTHNPFRYVWSRVHFLLRLAGLTGLLAAGVGVAWTCLDRGATADAFTAFGQQLGEASRALLRRNFADPALTPAVWLTLGGALAVVLALLVETFLGFRFAAGRRSVFGTNALAQIGLALALLVGVNVFAHFYYFRFDWTHDRHFTLAEHLSPALLAQLKELKNTEPTTIVVYQRNKSFSHLSDKPDVYDYAASPRVVESVRDLVDEFREMGGRFRVVVLDVEEEGYNDKLKKLTENAPELKEAIDKTPENSIFFHAAGKVQRLGFHDVFQLDKKASEEQGNLVLINQGVDSFARKLLNIEEKRPRIALGIIHEVLGTEGSEELGMLGLKKALTARGFDVRDVILKKWSEFGPPEPAVLTYDESKFERMDAQLADLDENAKAAEEQLRRLEEYRKDFETKPLDELTKKYAKELGIQRVTEAIRRDFLERFLKPNTALIQFIVTQAREERDALVKEKSGLQVENLQEQRRISDLKAKADRMLADCDLLILPRMTLFNVARGEAIPNQLYRIDESQVAAVKDFLKAGKPVLACFGPPNEPAGRLDPSASGPDALEDLFADLGFKLAKQAVLFNVESKSFAERRGGLLILGANVDVPPVQFDWKSGAGYPAKLLEEGRYDRGKPNPIRESLQLTARSLGADQKLDLRLRHPRPVYYDPPGDKPSGVQSIFMMTDAASWNETQPFPTRERTPRFEQPKPGDAATGTVDEKRRGPFPVAVAAQTTLPAAWYADKDAKPATARVAVIGHGGVFLGPTLPPVREKLLVDTCNWLLGRDDLLTKDRNRWSYPRVAFAPNHKAAWQWGAALGLPIAFAYLGLVVFMARRLR